MADSTDMDEKFTMMEKTIKALKKFVDDKNLHISQLMNKLEAFTPGESSHDVEESLAKSKIQKEKQSASSVTALSVQQLQDMIMNTIRAQYGGTPQKVDSIDLKDSKVQWVAINMSKKRTEEVSIKLSLSKGDM
ncbi:hypothetical protein H5410_052288 [Solanum commersonii]|uniref:Uncharacterized protein n=1 Tax=Solanum commersonii TaxID=4109 RepID=A0A9J5X2K5_SOLCO|nr:hypothetical protein H5410_052288 [Solanum commersonii]